MYQDINGKRDIDGDMLDVDVSRYDYIIATPPCNWWSQANPYYWKSEYALKTRHLLPLMLIKLGKQDKPFVIECVKKPKEIQREQHLQNLSRTQYNLASSWQTCLFLQCINRLELSSDTRLQDTWSPSQ